MRIVSFNIQHGLGRRGVVDLDALAGSARHARADVLGLQEVDVGVRRSFRADLAAVAADGLTVAFGPALSLGRGLNGQYGNALAVRGSLDDVETLRLPGPRGDEPRAALLARVTVDGTEVSVGVTHLSTRREVAQEQLTAAVAALVARPRPHVLLGDLNLLADEVRPVVTPAGLTLADPAEATFPADAPRARIDHVAVSRDLQVCAVRTAPAAVSDHLMLVVDVAPGR